MMDKEPPRSGRGRRDAAWLVAWAFAALAPATTMHGAEPVRDPAVEACGALPVRFNGRVTTLAAVASHWVRTISDADVVVDDAGKAAETPLRVWLDFAARHARARRWRVVAIEDPRLLELLELKPRPAPTSRGRANLYAFDEFADRIQAFEQERERLRSEPSFEGDGPNSLAHRRAIDDLERRIALATSLLQAFDGPREQSVEAFRDFQQLVAAQQRAESLPAVLAPRTAEERWLGFGEGTWDKHALEIVGDTRRKPHPGVDAWSALIDALGKDDATRVVELTRQIASLPRHDADGPLTFETPLGWRETGAPAAPIVAHYGDAVSDGYPVATFLADVGDDACRVALNYFPEPRASAAQIVNQWRVQSWLAPLPPDAMGARMERREVAGVAAGYVEVVPPTRLPGGAPPASLGAIVRRDSDLLVVTLAGPAPAVAAQREKFGRFLASLRLASPDRVARWFAPRPRDKGEGDGTGAATVTAVVVPGKTVAWCFVELSLQPLAEADLRKLIDEAVVLADFAELELDKLPADGDRARLAPRRVPKGWTASPYAEWYAFGSTGVAVRPLADYAASSEGPLGKHLRTVALLPPVPDEAAAARQWSTVEIGKRKIRVFASSQEK